MTAYSPGYRLRMYAPRSTDPDELTILTPPAGAAHSDEFKIASINGVAGYKPYLQSDLQGRRGRIDLLSRKVDIGTLVFTLIDKRLGADNLIRWWSAFFGDTKGKPSARLRVEADETLDGGTTWTRFATMELVDTALVGKVQIALSCRDRVETLKMKVFVGQPSSSLTYVAQPTLCPIGLRVASYGTFEPTPAFTGVTVSPSFNGASYLPSGETYVRLDPPSTEQQVGQNILTRNLLEGLAPGTVGDVFFEVAVTLMNVIPNYSGIARCHLKITSGPSAGQEGDFRVGGVYAARIYAKPFYLIYGYFIHELADGDVGYLATPAAGTTVETHLYIDGPVSSKRPLLIGDVDPATYIQDLCAGKFGYLYRSPDALPPGKSYGDPMRAIEANTDAGTAGCVSDLVGTRPPMRLPVTKVSDAQTEIERVCLENHWAPYLDKQGRLNIVDLRLPSTLAGVATITDTDLVSPANVAWNHDPTQAILRLDLTQYSETAKSVVDLANSTETYPTLESTALLIEETAHKLEPLYIGSIDYGDRVLQIDARGYRSMDGEEIQSQPRSVYIENALFELGHHLQRPFAYGQTTIPLPCRRTATVTSLAPGSLAIVAVDVIPDPATHKRGGARVCRVIELSEDGPRIHLRLIDLSFSAIADAPSLAQPAQEAGNTMTGVTVAVTLNASNHPVEVSYAVTDTSTAIAPANDSALWSVAGYKTLDRGIRMPRRRLASNATFAIRGLPPGMRIWVRGRSVPQDSVEPQLPSDYVLAGGTSYADTASLAAPSALTVISKTDTTVVLGWTNGAVDVVTEILLATPVGDTRRRVAIADPGSTRYELVGLEASTTYRAGVRHAVSERKSAEDTEDFTTDATGTTAPDILAFDILDVSA